MFSLWRRQCADVLTNEGVDVICHVLTATRVCRVAVAFTLETAHVELVMAHRISCGVLISAVALHGRVM